METININTNLIIRGDIICGENGILEVTGDITWGLRDCPSSEQEYLDKMAKMAGIHIEGDYDISDKEVIVAGNVFIYGYPIYDEKTLKGHMVAGAQYATV